jgi:hypothetical protein
VSVGIVLAKKESTTSTGSKAAARGATNKGFVPLKKVEVAPAATSSKRGKKGVVLNKSGVKGTNKASAKAEMEEYDHEDQGDDVDGAQGAGDDAVGGGDAEVSFQLGMRCISDSIPKGQDEHMSDGNDSDDGEEVSSEKKTKPKTKVRTVHEESQLTASPGIYCKEGARNWEDAPAPSRYARHRRRGESPAARHGRARRGWTNSEASYIAPESDSDALVRGPRDRGANCGQRGRGG